MRTYGAWSKWQTGEDGRVFRERVVERSWLGFQRTPMVEREVVSPHTYSQSPRIARALNYEPEPPCPTCAGKYKGCPAPSPSDAQRAFVSRLAGLGFMVPGSPKWDGVNRRKAERRAKVVRKRHNTQPKRKGAK